MGQSPHEILRFRQFELDVGRGGVRVAGRDVELRPKAFELLRHLAENPGRLLSKDDLCAVLWPRTSVSDDSLAQIVRELRERLGDSNHTLIRTVPRRGYLLEAERDPEGESSRQARAAAKPARALSARWEAAGWFAFGVVLGAVFLGGAWSLTPRLRDVAPAAAPRPLSIAVLPFAHAAPGGNAPQIAQNLTDALTTALGRLAPGTVAARGSAAAYDRAHADVRRAGRELGVRFVVEGSLRRAGGLLLISARLLRAETAEALWTASLEERADDNDAAEEVASRLSRLIYAEMFRAEAVNALRRRSGPQTATDYFIRAKALYHRTPSGGDLSGVRRLFGEAVRLDPVMSMAWIGMAKAYLRNMRFSPTRSDDLAKAAAAAERAIALRPHSVDAHIVRGWVRYEQRHVEDALVQFEFALRLDPRNVDALAAVAAARTALGEPEAALAALRQAMRLSPTDFDLARWQRFMGVAHLHLAQDEEAVAWLRKATVLNPRDPLNHLYFASALFHSGREAEARQAIADLRRIAPAYSLRNFIASEASSQERFIAQRRRIYEGLRRAGLPEG